MWNNLPQKLVLIFIFCYLLDLDKLLSSLSPNNINPTFELACKERENEECLKYNNTKCISCYNGYYLSNYIA